MARLDHIAKDKVLVMLEQMNLPVMYGYLFVVPVGRVQDILNDEREFLPFQHVAGKMTMLAKGTISNISEIVNITSVTQANGPYHGLGVSKHDDMANIVAHYREMIRNCHPDKFRGEEFPAELPEILDEVSQNINAHFAAIKKDKAKDTV